MAGWIGVDLDGTLAHYDKWRGVYHIGKPVQPMVDRIKKWLKEGREVRIVTARVASKNERDNFVARDVIYQWLRVTELPPLPIQCAKDFDMIELWDDRAVQVIPNTGERADGRE